MTKILGMLCIRWRKALRGRYSGTGHKSPLGAKLKVMVLSFVGKMPLERSGVCHEAEERMKHRSCIPYSFMEGYNHPTGYLSGERLPNVVIDNGFSDRHYYAFTNEHGQLNMVTGAEIILQDDDNEPVLESGRYYPDESKVPALKVQPWIEGHVIADSLGGVTNTYNITHQDSTLKRDGDQA